mmetsp:Transcript_32867/g.91512  ORF Transcript_32867/g.91512 Transcript_32867/m.91512 type:complete len:200 (+) Transcript_32867:932-1531(+)
MFQLHRVAGALFNASRALDPRLDGLDGGRHRRLGWHIPMPSATKQRSPPRPRWMYFLGIQAVRREVGRAVALHHFHGNTRPHAQARQLLGLHVEQPLQPLVEATIHCNEWQVVRVIAEGQLDLDGNVVHRPKDEHDHEGVRGGSIHTHPRGTNEWNHEQAEDCQQGPQCLRKRKRKRYCGELLRINEVHDANRKLLEDA